ncbi:hypothetical protein C8R44DRAFT_946212 [Mycena epipterygia]|nr:hypothetical protein C8R44DRAFT_946212 [Mycena epipterygia]
MKRKLEDGGGCEKMSVLCWSSSDAPLVMFWFGLKPANQQTKTLASQSQAKPSVWFVPGFGFGFRSKKCIKVALDPPSLCDVTSVTSDGYVITQMRIFFGSLLVYFQSHYSFSHLEQIISVIAVNSRDTFTKRKKAADRDVALINGKNAMEQKFFEKLFTTLPNLRGVYSDPGLFFKDLLVKPEIIGLLGKLAYEIFEIFYITPACVPGGTVELKEVQCVLAAGDLVFTLRNQTGSPTRF